MEPIVIVPVVVVPAGVMPGKRIIAIKTTKTRRGVENGFIDTSFLFIANRLLETLRFSPDL
jgi:hypothetical protein